MVNSINKISYNLCLLEKKNKKNYESAFSTTKILGYKSYAMQKKQQRIDTTWQSTDKSCDCVPGMWKERVFLVATPEIST